MPAGPVTTTNTSKPKTSTKKPAQVKAPPTATIDKATAPASDNSALINALKSAFPGAFTGMTDDQILASVQGASGANSAEALASQHAVSFLKTLQSDPTQLKRWQQALAAWNTSLNRQYNYTPGLLDDNTMADTAAVMKFQAENPSAVRDEWDAVQKMTQASSDPLNAQAGAAAKLAGANIFRPLADDAVNAGIDSAFQKAFGRDATPDQRATFNQQFRSLEAQNFNTNLGVTNSGQAQGEVPQLSTPEQMTYEVEKGSPEAFGYAARQAALSLGDIIRAGH